MSRVLFLPLALHKSLQGRTKPLPLSVAARQIPRQLAELVAGQGSLHSSYLPLVGNDQGRRGFVGFEDLLPPDRLDAIFAPMQRVPDYVVDGLLQEDRLQLRLSQPDTGTTVREIEVPFDPNELQALLNRLILELWDLFDLPGRPSTVPPMDKEAFACFLAGRDEELAAQANLTRPSGESAFVPFLAALQHEPGQERVLGALLELARLYIEQGRGDAREACQALAAAAGTGSPPLRFLEIALRLMRQAGVIEFVPAAGLPYLRERPRDADTLLLVGAALWAHEQPASTRDVLGACVREWDEDEPSGENRAGVLALLAESYRVLGEPEARQNAIEQLARCKEWSVHAAETLSTALCAEGRHEEALAAVEHTLARHPGARRLQLEKGRCLLLAGRGEDAREPLRIARSGPPELAAEAERLAGFVERPELLAAIDAIERLLRTDRHDEALRLAKQSVRRAPELAEPRYLLGLVQSARGKTRRAVRELRRSLEIDPSLAEARNRLGILLVALGRYREAYDELRRVLDERPDEIGPHLHMAQACYYLRRLDEGRSHLERAAELDPEHPLVRQTRATFYSIPEATAESGQDPVPD